MRTPFLLPLVVLASLSVSGQVTTYVVAPGALSGHVECTWAMWPLTPDLNDGNNAVTDTAVFVDDGTVADSLGCDTLLNGAAIFGNIAVVYRGDCEFSLKAMHVQNEGARALVVINYQADPIEMGEGVLGSGITIPVVMISDSMGGVLRNDILAGNAVLYLGPMCALTNTCNDVHTHLAHGYHVPGFNTTYWINVQNASWTTSFSNVTAKLYYDPSFAFVSASQPPVINTPGHLEWSIATLDTLSLEQFAVEVQIPAIPGLIGTFTSAQGIGLTTVPDDNTQNDVYSVAPGIFGAFDPNDKQAQTSSLTIPGIYAYWDEHVDYTIRFQNTGNAPANQVVLVDTLSTVFPYSPLHVLAASHMYTAERIGRLVRFTFPNIQLPDSASDSAGSQGFVSFRLPLDPIDPLLPKGTVIANAADIYFDANPPIRTSTSELVLDDLWSVEDLGKGVVRLIPNPTTGQVEVVLADATAIDDVVVRSITGAELLQLRWPNGNTSFTFDVSALASGMYTLELRGTSHRHIVQLVKD